MDIDHTDVIGVPLIGTWFNAIFFAYEVAEMVKYFSRYPRDPIVLKSIVGLLLVIDVGSIIMVASYAYLNVVTHYGDQTFLLKDHWPSFTNIPLLIANTFIVQMFMIHRCWCLTKKWYFVPPLIIPSVLTAGGGIWFNITFYFHPSQWERNKTLVALSVWLVSTTVCDILIAATLVITLKVMTKSSKLTRRKIRGLIYKLISTGSLTAIMATVCVTTYFHNPMSNVWIGVSICLGRIYAISLMFNLNNRRCAPTRLCTCQKAANTTRNVGENGLEDEMEFTIFTTMGALFSLQNSITIDNSMQMHSRNFPDRYSSPIETWKQPHSVTPC